MQTLLTSYPPQLKSPPTVIEEHLSMQKGDRSSSKDNFRG